MGYLCKVYRHVWAYVCNYGCVTIGHEMKWYFELTNLKGMLSHVLVYRGITLLVSTEEG